MKQDDPELNSSKHSLNLICSFNLFVNVSFVCYSRSQIFEICHILKGFVAFYGRFITVFLRSPHCVPCPEHSNDITGKGIGA
jgi:hypothetical protein